MSKCWLFHSWRYLGRVRNPLYGKKELVNLNNGDSIDALVDSNDTWCQFLHLYKCRRCGKEKVESPSLGM
jgi:hypothetical protein